MWRFVSAREIGSSHQKVGLPCQDRCDCRVLPNGILIAAVADGAGSAEFAEIGAEIAVSRLMAELSSRLIGDPPDDLCGVLRQCALIARRDIIQEAETRFKSPRELASTLLAVVVTPVGGAALQIGDGVIVIRAYDDDGWSWVFWPQRGEYANTTNFLVEDDAELKLEVSSLPGIVTDIALSSDGLEPLALHYASKAVHSPFFDGMFAPLVNSKAIGPQTTLETALGNFLRSEKVRSRTDDDISLVLASRRTTPLL
jgi:muconolactone delta-isomerase